MYDSNQVFYWIEDHWNLFSARYQLLYNRVRAVSNIIYNGEVSKAAIAVRILTGAPFGFLGFHLLDIMTTVTNSTSYPNVDAVINAVIKTYFLPDLKRKLRIENPAIVFAA